MSDHQKSEAPSAGHFEAGRSAFQRGDYAGSEQFFLAALEMGDEEASCRRHLARVYNHSRNWARALEQWAWLRERDRTQIEPQLQVARALYRLGRHSESERAFQLLLQLAPDNEEARQMLAQIHLEAGRSAFRVNDLDLSHEAFLKALASGADEPVCRQHLARIYNARQDWPRALGEWQWLRDRNPASIEPRLQVARALSRLGRHAEAIPVFGELLRVSADHPEARQYLVQAQVEAAKATFKAKDYESSEALILRALKTGGDARVCRQLLARIYNALQDWEKALEQWRWLQTQVPLHLEAQQRVADSLFRLGRLAAAAVEYQRALQIAPDHHGARRRLEQIERATRASSAELKPGQYDAGIKVATSLIALGRCLPAMEVIARVAIGAESFERRLGLAERVPPGRRAVDLVVEFAARADAILAAAQLVDGLSPLSREIWSARLATFARDAEIPANQFKILFAHARALMSTRQHGEAVLTLAEAIRIEPLNVKALLEMGKALANLNRYPEARAALMEAIRVEPFRVEARAELAKLLLAVHQTSDACTTLARAVQLVPERLDIGLQYAAALKRDGRLAEAEAELERLLPFAATPKAVADLQEKLADMYLARGDVSAGIAALQSTLEVFPAHAGASIALARHYLSQGQHDEALARIDASLSLSPDNLLLLQEKGAVLLAIGRFDVALTVFSKVANRRGGRSAEFLAGQAARRLDLFADAAQLLEKDLEKNPDSVPSLVELGKVYARERRFEQALELFTHAVEQMPSNYDALHGAGVMLRSLARPKDAVEFYLRALEVAPGRTNSRIDLGVSYEAIGDLERAHRAYADAVASAPRSVNARLALARMEYELGATEAALDHCRFAQEVSPQDPRVQAYLHLMAKRASRSKVSMEKAVILLRRPRDSDLEAIAHLGGGVQEVFGDFSDVTRPLPAVARHLPGGWREFLMSASSPFVVTSDEDVPSVELIHELSSKMGNRVGFVSAPSAAGSTGVHIWRKDLLIAASTFHGPLEWPQLIAEVEPMLQRRRLVPELPSLQPAIGGREAWLISSSGAKLFGGVEHFLRSMVPLFRELGFVPVIVGLLERTEDADPEGQVDGIQFVNLGRSVGEIRELAFKRRPAIALATTGIGYELVAALDGFSTRIVYGSHFWRDMFHGGGSFENVDLTGRPRAEFRSLISSVDQAYSNSVYTRQMILRHFDVSQPILFSLPFDQPALNQERKPGKYVLLMNGRPDKGFGLLLEVARLVPEARFLVVAAQVSRARVEEQVDRAGLENVEIRDWTADTEGLYKEARVVLVPSYAFVETFSRVVIEAQRFGVPVLGSNRGNVANLLDPLNLALPEEPDVWASFIRRLCTDELFWREQSEKARANADRYPYSEQRARLQRIVQSAVGRVAVGVGSGIGNIIQTTPAIRRLSEHLGRPVDILMREEFPGCAVLLEGAEWVGTIVTSDDDASEIRYDAVILLDSYGKVIPRLNSEVVYVTRRHFSFDMTRDMHEAEFNLFCCRELMKAPYRSSDTAKYFIGAFGRAGKQVKRIGFHAGSKGGVWAAKQWPYFDELALLLTSAGYEVCSFGGAGEYVDGTIDLTRTPLEQTIQNIAGCAYFVANDSGLMHIADALGIPLTTIFAPTSIKKNGPLSTSSQVICVDKSCSPCQFDPARLAACACIREIPVTAVYDMVCEGMAAAC